MNIYRRELISSCPPIDGCGRKVIYMIITIDGATGVGKSTVAKKVAEKLDFAYISTGRVYRTIAYCVLQEDRNEKVLLQIEDLKLTFNSENIMIANGIEAEELLQNESIACLAAEIGANADFKEKVSNKIIQAIGSQNAVVEGRKAGTILYPNAFLKIYLYADMERRVERKIHENEGGNYSETAEKLQIRDKLVTSSRADNSCAIDTSSKTWSEVVNEILSYYRMCKQLDS